MQNRQRGANYPEDRSQCDVMSLNAVRRTVARWFALVVLSTSVLIFALEEAFNLYRDSAPELAELLLY